MPEPTPLEPGDTVVLKSGGPVMTLQARSQNLAYCSWYDGERLQHGTFALESLQAAARNAALRS